VGARAALFVKEIEDFAERVRIRGIPEKSAIAAHMDKAHLLQFFEMVRERGSGDAEFFLNFAGNHSCRVGGQEQAENLEARLGTKSREAVGGASDQEGIGLAHVSIIAEIWKNVKSLLLSTFLRECAS
jgi:hypothetical protein